MSRSHTHMWWLKIGRTISSVEVPPEELGVSAPPEAPQPRVPVLRRVTTSGCEKQWRLWLSETEGF